MENKQEFEESNASESVKNFSMPIIHKDQIPLALLNNKKPDDNRIIMAADVGGTKTNLALYKIKNGALLLLKENSYRTKMVESFTEMVHDFHAGNAPSIDGICLGVAGHVTQGRVKGTNFPWKIDREEIHKELQIPSVSLVNDMEANAYGLAALSEKDFVTLKDGSNIPGNAALISPGTGLGEAGLYWDGSHYHPFATEGGHCDFSPRNDLDVKIWQYLQKKFGHISWERLISGPGILNIYEVLRSLSGRKEPDWLKENFQNKDPSVVITETALDGKDPVCKETLELFIRFLAIESAQLALKFKATGGIYIGGGILPNIIKGINREIFQRDFVQSDLMGALLQTVPIKVILNEKTALLGAVYYAAMTLEQEPDRYVRKTD